MAVVVGGLPSPLREVDELVAEVDEGGAIAPAHQIEFDEAPVEGERLVDIPYLEPQVVDADRPCLYALIAHSMLTFR